MENNRSKNFDFNLDDLIKNAENIDKTPNLEEDVIAKPNNFDGVFKKLEPLKTVDAEKENKLAEARKKIIDTHQGNS